MLHLMTPPVLEVVTVEDAKRHLRVDFDDDDTYVEELVAAAVAHIDGPTGFLGRALAPQQLVLTMDSFPHCGGAIHIPLPPLISAEEVAYLDPSGEQQSYTGFRVIGVGAPFGARIRPKAGEPWPQISRDRDAVTVTFTAGYTDGKVPPSVKHALLLIVSHWYENRDASTEARISELPLGVQALLNPLRVWR